MIGVETKGDNYKTSRSLHKMLKGDQFSDLDRYGQMGVRSLSAATPVDTGLAAHSWYHQVVRDVNPEIIWSNYDIEGGYSVIILIQYGHGTGTGGYVEGRDIVNRAMLPLYDTIANDVWEKVRNA